MCGVAGFVARQTGDDAMSILTRMTDAITSRGPDASGAWVDPGSGVGLGHRRLSIVDLSPLGVQPMASASGRYQMVFNGEVYNFKRIRAELEPLGHRFRGHSDTEVMLAAFEQWGVVPALERFVGMFAIALWDTLRRELTLVRDRLGKKPLYYGTNGGAFLFGSELKALAAFPGFRSPVDRGALAQFVRHNYVPAPRSIFRDIRKLPPATALTVKVGEAGFSVGEPIAYWSAEEQFAAGQRARFSGSFGEAVDHLDGLLRDAVALRMVADVPLGAFLSGGIDSSLVVALMQAQSAQPVRTFTIGFDEPGFNEAEHAKAVAVHLGTQHTELYVRPTDALDVVPRLPDMFDEPFADSSQLPTYLVCAMARRDVTVALSGDGGDEGFCGYNRYIWWRKLWKLLGAAPAPVAKGAGALLRAVPTHGWDALGSVLGPVLRGSVGTQSFGARIHKIAELASAGSPAAVYLKLVSHWDDPASVVIGGVEPSRISAFGREPKGLDAYTEHMTLLDTLTYLPDDILVKVDRASMAVSLEARAPLLDHRVLEYAWTLPLDYKLADGKGKRILRELLFRYVPRELVERPKTGFGVPIDSWLRGPLRDWAEHLLDPARLRDEGYFHVAPVRQAWDDHQSGRRGMHYYLWDILMFQAWLERHRSWCVDG